MKNSEAIKLLYNKGYTSTSDGIILNPKGEIISGYLSHSGYRIISYRASEKTIKISAHRFVAYCKYGDRLFAENIEVRHINGIKTDNSFNNLRIGTHSQNMLDIPVVDRIKNAKYASSFNVKHDHTTIRTYYKNVRSYAKTMAKFNISSKGTLHFILNNF